MSSLYIIQYSLVPVDIAEDLIYGRFTMHFPPNSLTQQRTNIPINVVITALYTIRREAAAGVLDEPDSAKPAQQSSHTGPVVYIGWIRFQPM